MPFISKGGVFQFWGFFPFVTVRFGQGVDTCSKPDQLDEIALLIL